MAGATIAATAATVGMGVRRQDTPPPAAPLPPVVREATAARINRLVNLPEVHPHVSLPGQGEIDLAPFVANPANLVWMNVEGSVGISFDRLTDGIFEAHTVAAAEARGPECLEAVRSIVASMFLTSDAVELWTRVPVTNRPADALARAVGGVCAFERPALWPTAEDPIGIKFYRLDIATWMQDAAFPASLGRWASQRLRSEHERLDIPGGAPTLDQAHERYLGAALGMILGGQAAKAVVLFNRMALVAGWPPITVPSLDPLIVSTGPDTLRIYPDNTNFEVLECRAEF